MSEQVNIFLNGDNITKILILNALSRAGDNATDDACSKVVPGQLFVTVECKVNGVDVPIIEAFQDIIERVDALVTERAGKMAMDVLTGSKYASLFKELRDNEYKVITELEKLGLKVPSDYDVYNTF